MSDGDPTYAELLARTDAPPGSTWGLWPGRETLGCLNRIDEGRRRYGQRSVVGTVLGKRRLLDVQRLHRGFVPCAERRRMRERTERAVGQIDGAQDVADRHHACCRCKRIAIVMQLDPLHVR